MRNGAEATPRVLTLNCGSSANTAPPPLRIAELRARHHVTSVLCCGARRETRGVRHASALMRAVAQDLVATRDDGSDARIRLRRVQAAFSQAQCARHVRVISG